ncbi:MAG: anti-sigma factor [Sphingosinicella sp.]|nr:anti-sigma factor [Sphingosinicella sp.]
MSTRPEDDRELFAAEYALGILEAEERVQAERLVRSDGGFARLVEDWDERLSPMLAEFSPQEPSPDMWNRINQALDRDDSRSSNVVSLDRRLTLWRTYAAFATAAAAALLLVVGLDRTQTLPVEQPSSLQPRQPVLVANVAAEDRSTAFVVTFDPNRESLLVIPALASPAPGHDHELWVIPASGTPRSLGLVASTSSRNLNVRADLLPDLRRDATLAISVEPAGGSPTGQPTGPVVATGKMILI